MAKTKKSIEFDIDDPRAGKVAEAISSKSAKRILNLLAENGEMSGSEVANELDMPLNTTGYNLKKLVDAGLVDKSKKSFWSSKGKKMELYKVSNKKIIISPKKISKSVIVGFVGFLAILAIAIIFINSQNDEMHRVVIGEGNEGIIVNDNSILKSFKNIDELKNFIRENSGAVDYYGGGVVLENSGIKTWATAESASGETASSSAKVTANDFSKTNVQVQGVDEPDIVKNNGKYIFTAFGNAVSIVDAFPAENMRVNSEIKFDDAVNNIFINEDNLVVFTQHYEFIDSGVRCGKVILYGVRCGGYDRQSVKVYVYDVDDVRKPQLVEEFEFDGNYANARMIDDKIYIISTKWVYNNWFDMPVYSVSGVEKVLTAEDVYYIDSFDDNYVFNLISAIDLDDGKVNTEVYLMGSSSNVYVSKENIYLTYQKRISQNIYLEKYIDEVIEKSLPNSEIGKVRDIMESDDWHWEKSRKINEVIDIYIKSLGASKGFEFMKGFEMRVINFSERIQKETEKTIIHRIEIKGMNIDYEAVGEVPGIVLNQFSMDENEEYFRIATTTGGWRTDRNLNHVYILDMDLDIVGSVEDLAEGERIYSTRFLEDRLYMVTFRQVDPLFAIDLSDPRNPRVLGELKITGYSGYLHPYDKNHLIGIGMEASEEGRVQGIKVALFDVRDAGNPREVDTYVIDQYTWANSEAVYEHKAVLFDKERNLLVIPVSYTKEVGIRTTNGWKQPYYEYWQGAYVFDINVEGIDLRGKISHYEESEVDNYHYSYGLNVRRALYMDNVLYTISQGKIKANNLWTIRDISEVDLKYEETKYYASGGGVAVAEPEITVDSVVLE